MSIFRWQLLLLALLSATSVSAQTRQWQSPVDGAYTDPARWSQQDVPDNPSETARFDRLGSYRVSFGPTATSTGDLEVTKGTVSFAGAVAGSTDLTIGDDVQIERATLLLERDGLPGDVLLTVGDQLSLIEGGTLRLLDTATLTATSIEIGAGTNSVTTALDLNDDAAAQLGDVSLAQVGGGSFEGSLTVLGNAVATVDNLTIATTGAADRRGLVQIFGGQVQQNAGGVTQIGSANGGEALVVTGGGGQFEGNDVRVAATGTLRNTNGGQMSFATALSIDGGAYIELAGSTRAFGPGISIDVTNGGSLDLVGTPLTLAAGQSLAVSSSTVASEGGMVIDGGTLTVGSSTATFDTSVTNQGGTIEVSSGAIAQFNGDYTGNGVTGSGKVTFQAEVEPGQSPGTTTFSGDAQWMPSATLNIEIGGTASGEYDRIVIGGNATLAGTLSIELIEPVGGPSGIFAPVEGDSFEFFRADDFSGSFASIDAPALFSGLEWRLTPTASSITLSVVTPGLSGDFNYDGTVDAADYTVWRDTLSATGTLLSADSDGNHLVDGADYSVWQNAFGTSATVTTIPEPTTVLLSLLGGMGLVFKRSEGMRSSF